MRIRLPGPWQHPEFLKVWGSDTISVFGVYATSLALPLTAVALGASAAQVGLLTTAQALPALLLGLVVGLGVDRCRRRPLLIGANVARAVLIGSIPVTALIGVLHLAQLYAVAFLSGAAALVFVVAYQAFLPTVVPREHRVAGNSALRASEAMAQFAGPGLGGLLVPLLGAPFTLALGALASLGSALTLSAIHAPELSPAPTGKGDPIGRALGAGVRFVLYHPILRPLLVGDVIAGLGRNMIVGISVLFIVRDLQLPPVLLGAITGAAGPAALAGAVLASRLVRRCGAGTTLIGATAVGDMAALLVPLAQGALSVVLALLVAWRVLGGAAEAVGGIVYLTQVQSVVPPQLQGRVNAAVRVCGWGAVALGGLLGGGGGQVIGLRPTLALAACAMLLAPIWLACSPVRALRD
jgi:MFS family permease